MRWPAYSLMLLAPPPSRAGRLLRLTAPVRPVREFRHLISSSGPYRVGSSCRRPPEREARVRGPSRHANLTRAGRGTIACASPTCRLDADDVECRRVPSTLAVRSASAGTSRSVPRRATLQSYNPQAEPREACGGAATARVCRYGTIAGSTQSTGIQLDKRPASPASRRNAQTTRCDTAAVGNARACAARRQRDRNHSVVFSRREPHSASSRAPRRRKCRVSPRDRLPPSSILPARAYARSRCSA